MNAADKALIKHRLVDILTEQLGVDEARLTSDARFVEDLKADSLDVVEIVMALEEEFGIAIDDDVVDGFRRVADVLTHLEKQVGAKVRRSQAT